MQESQVHHNRKHIIELGFGLFQMRKAMNFHFQEDVKYDWTKYGGRVRGSVDEFSKSPTKHRYCATARQSLPHGYTNEMCLFLIHQKHGYVPERMISPKVFKNITQEFNTTISEWEQHKAKAECDVLVESGMESLRIPTADGDNPQLPTMVEKFLAGEISWMLVVATYNRESTLRHILRTYNGSAQEPIVDMFMKKMMPYFTFIDKDMMNSISFKARRVWEHHPAQTAAAH